jgi:hypothetical protein
MTIEFEIIEIGVEEGVDLASIIKRLSNAHQSAIGGTLLSFNVV